MASMKRSEVERPLAYLRLRLAAGAYDAAPKVLDVSWNGVPAEQSVSATLALPIRASADVPTSPLKPGDRVALRIQLDERGRIERLRQEGEPDDPRFLVLDYRPPTASAEGVLRLEAVWLGRGDGLPRQSLELPRAPVEAETLALFSFEGESGWWKWEAQPDLDASGPTARHFVLDAQKGVAAFGDGERGLVPSEGSLLFASYSVTQVESGNVASGAIEKLDDTLHNRTIPNWTELKTAIASITNPQAANGGATAETVPHATGRAVEMMEKPVRAVTAEDYERLARETPGVRLARVTAKANLHPALPCSRVPGVVTVIVLPELPRGKPSPSVGLKRAVRSFLERRRVVGTRVEVVGPTYTTLAIRARVAPAPGMGPAALRSRIVETLGLYFDPLRGGADGKGWPFGRDVYRAEILAVIDAVPGVDHVLSLELLGGSCEPECGSVCVGPIGLVASGSHEIDVVSARDPVKSC
jgi:predicted phage baseplate assembly protein